MNMAQKRVEQISGMQAHSIICAIFMANYGSIVDENCDGHKISTFTFTYKDESELKIDTEGQVYADNDYQYRIYG